MILSHDFQFIFVKTRKTAGTSIEISLSRYLGPLDIATPISFYDEAARAEIGFGPKNYIGIKGIGFPDEATDWSDGQKAAFMKENGRKAEEHLAFFNHMSCDQIKGAVGENIYRKYFKFCVERNPFDRAISLYYHANGEKKYGSMIGFLKGHKILMNSSQYSLDGGLGVDRVICFDRLPDELQNILGGLGIDFDGWLPHAKGHFRKDKRPWREVLSREEIALIEEVFAPDIEAYESLFGRIERPEFC